MKTYKTFKRSVKNWTEFANARKTTVSTGLTRQQAFENCAWFNENRTPSQIANGTKMEFTEE